MSTTFTNQTKCELLAQRLGQDIQRRGLKPGDRYITAVEAAQELGVSRMSADRAMNVLVKKQFLIRQRGRGTFIGPGLITPVAKDVVHVHYAIFGEGESALICPSQAATLTGLRKIIPAAILHTHFLPFADACHHARQLVQSEPSTNRSAWILNLSPREVQQWFAGQSIPAIVMGGAYPGIALPEMQADQTEAGRQLLQLAHSLEARRFVFINRQNWRQGDVAALNGALQEMASLGITSDQFEVCNIPGDNDIASRILRELLQRCTDSSREDKLALLCRAPNIAKTVLNIAGQTGLNIPDDMQIVYNRPWTDDSPVLAPCIDETATIEEGFSMIAGLLKQLLSGNQQNVEPIRLPLSCVLPQGHEVDNSFPGTIESI